MKLELAKKKLFEGMEIECYVNVSREDGDFFMTRRQIGEALEYKTASGYNNILQRNSDSIGNPTIHKLCIVEGNRDVARDIELYTFKQLFQILRFSKQPKANLFMDWATITLQELITGRAELRFKKKEDEDTYKEKIDNLTNKVEIMTNELGDTKEQLKTLIDSSTINSRQAQKLLQNAKDRVNSLLEGAHSTKYKKESRMYFKNLWLDFGKAFTVSSYKDLNPLNYNNGFTFINNWSMN